MQIAWNLVHNAAKFTPAGGRLTIRTSNPPGLAAGFGDRAAEDLPAPRRRVRGHRDRDRRRRCCRGSSRPSSRATTTCAAVRTGLGLGLAICRSLAEAMGGRLTASSAGAGLGSTFRLELTTVPAPIIRDAPARPRPGRRRPTLASLRGVPACDPAGRGQQGHAAVSRDLLRRAATTSSRPTAIAAAGALGLGRAALRPADLRYRAARRQRAGADARAQRQAACPASP